MTRFNRENPYATLPQLEKELDQAARERKAQSKEIKKLKEEIESSVAGVSGVKGNEEATYRTGNVNLTQANIGVLALTNAEIEAIFS